MRRYLWFMFLPLLLAASPVQAAIVWDGFTWDCTRGDLDVDLPNDQLLLVHLDIIPGTGVFANALPGLSPEFAGSEQQTISLTMDGGSDLTGSFALTAYDEIGQFMFSLAPDGSANLYHTLTVGETEYGGASPFSGQRNFLINRDEFGVLSFFIDGVDITGGAPGIEKIGGFEILSWDRLSGGSHRVVTAFDTVPAAVSAVPEPFSLVLLLSGLSGLGAMGGFGRSRRRLG